MEQRPIVFVVDDDPAECRGLSRLIRAAGLAAESFQSARSFLLRGPRSGLACMVVDACMPGLDGLEFLQQLRLLGISIPIIFISGHPNVRAAASAMKAGAVDFLEKPVNAGELLDAIQRGLEMDRRARLDLAQRQTIQDRIESLTPRELQVLLCVVAGLLNKQIAAELGTCEKTIKVHRARVMNKMQVRSVAQLTRLALRVGIDTEVDVPLPAAAAAANHRQSVALTEASLSAHAATLGSSADLARSHCSR